MIKRLGVTVLLASLFLFLASSSRAQTVAGSIIGTAVDQSGAVVPGATATLTFTATGAMRTATADARGVFHFPNLSPGIYTLVVNSAGFKQKTTTNIEVGQGETRDLGKIALEIGSITQEVTVSAAVTPVQTSSSEKSTELTDSELNALPLRGRDLFGALKLVPGVVDTTNARDVTSPNAIGGITINGNTSAKNFTVDGITDMDTGSNGTLHYEPNMDSIQEVKVLSSNYQAEYGRNSGGTITVVTKSGTQQFHGSAWANYRNNWMNANDWFNKNNYSPSNPNAGCTGCYGIIPRQKYRYNVDGYSIGGPVYVPGHFNTEKKRLFFFFSQEYTHQFAPGSTQKRTVPTLNEIGLGPGSATCPAGSGDFGGLVDSSGNPIVIEDPLNGYKQFPNNCIPASRIDPQGQKMLAFFPLPNYNPAPGTSDFNKYNFLSQESANHARRNDTLRIDVNPTSKLTAYFRYINDFDDMISLYNGIQFVGNEPRLNGQSGNPVNSVDHPNPGHGYAGSAIWTISPTLVNEATVAEDWNTWSWYLGPDQIQERSRGSKYNPGLNPPVLFPLDQYHALADGSKGTNPTNANDMFNLLPGFSFGGGQNAEMSFAVGTSPYFNDNPIWTIEDNLSKVVGQHQFKMGVYWETNSKVQPAGNSYTGSYNFGTSTTNPVNTGFIPCPKGETCGDGYANGLLGYFNSYTQQTQRSVFDVKYQNLEFYVQDNWRVTRRLTLDLGIRFYHQTPQYDSRGTFAEFVPSLYNVNSVPKIFVPTCVSGAAPPCSAADQRAMIPGDTSGTLYPSSDIGAFVPGTGDPANGMKALGTSNPYTTSAIAPGPRIGFAFDVFGNGKTAIRGGFGVFFNRLDGNQVYNMSGSPPVAFTQADNFDCIGSIANACPTNGAGLQGIQNAGTGGLISPVSVNFFGGTVPWLVVRNGSLGIQQDLGFNTVLDVAWTGNFTRHANLRINLNPIPLGANFNDVNAYTGQALTQNGSVLERTIYPGWQDINQESFDGYTNYNALDVSLQRRLSNGLLFGVAYTWSKALTLGTINSLLTPAQNNALYYGPSGSDRRQSVLINYSYDLPNITRKWNNAFLGFALDNWTFSGLTTLQSGAPFTPSFSGGDITGTGSIGSRPNYVGGINNLTAINFGSCSGWGTPGPGVKYIFNPCAFAPPQQAATWNTKTNSIQYTNCTATCLGTVGENMFYGHGINNFDLTLEKRIPLGNDSRRAFRLQFQAYNAFNHPQFTGVNTSVSYSTTFCNKAPAGGCNNTSPLLIYSQTPHNTLLGQATSTTGYRILSGNLRFEF